MFKTLELSNFRKHRDLRIDFESGLVAIRGANERGKTTIQEAIGYAMFGSGALRQSFDEVVTWGESESTLGVKLTLTTGMVIDRSKRGAEIRMAGKVVVTGQREVTRYVETMLGASADVATKMMLASQGKLRGALEGGATEAAALIESLADFDLLDRVVNLITSNMPTGHTQAAEATLKAAQEQLDALQPADVEGIAIAEAGEIQLNAQIGLTYAKQKDLSHQLNDLDMAGARRFMVDLAAAQRDVVALGEQLAGVVVPPEPVAPIAGAAQIDVWRREMMGLKDAAARREAYAAFSKLVEPEVTWDDDAASFDAEKLRLQQIMNAGAQEETRLLNERVKVAARKITETSCAFCGKDLSQVPEVTRRNIEADEEYATLTQLAAEAHEQWQGAGEMYAEMVNVERNATAYEKAASRYIAFLIQIDDRFPARFQWRGEVPAPAGEIPDYNRLITQAEAEQRAYDTASARQAALLEQVESLNAQLDRKTLLVTQGRLSGVDFAAKITAGEALEREIADLGIAIAAAKADLNLTRQWLDSARAAAVAAAAHRERAGAAFAAAQTALDQLRANNALVKKIRAARPVISDKLWSIVLASVSHHFSQIRGVVSDISRSDNGFKCDGQAVQGLSGSTLDALGLSIRIALTKTFLPNSSFMMLDEPGSACDDERESSMLGLIAAADFDQVLLVTHSAMADAFATQVVQL